MSVPPARTYIVVAPTDEALQPPKGVTPNFDDPFTLRPYSNVAFSLGMVFTGVFMVARVYTKARIVRKLRWEDCMYPRQRSSILGVTSSKIPVYLHGFATVAGQL